MVRPLHIRKYLLQLPNYDTRMELMFKLQMLKMVILQLM